MIKRITETAGQNHYSLTQEAKEIPKEDLIDFIGRLEDNLQNALKLLKVMEDDGK